jgi:PAS domain S-box-containing protein
MPHLLITGQSRFDFQSDLFDFPSVTAQILQNLCSFNEYRSENDMENTKEQKQDIATHKVLLEELLKRSTQAIVLLGTNAEIVFCSDSIFNIAGYKAAELVGLTAFDLFNPADLPAAWEQHQHLRDCDEGASACLVQIRNKQGQMIWIDVVVKNLLHIPSVNALFVLLKKNLDDGIEERKIVQAIANAREQERTILAGELHDNVNQIITSTKLLLDTALLSPDKDDLLRLASANLTLASDEIRKLSYSMVSHDLQEKGLAFAVHVFLSTISKASKVKIRATFDEEAVAVLTGDQQLQVYRIIQEGINNILRHANATFADISLTRQEDLIYLVIADNGVGFSMNSLKPGVGLASIRNRVKLLRGHFHVRAPQGTGTIIEIHFPL